MRFKNGRQYLEYVRDRLDSMDERINKDLEHLAELKADFICLSGISNNERVQTSSNFDKTGDAIGKMIELENLIDERTDGLATLKEKATNKILRIPNKVLANDLIDKYINRYTDNEIALKEGITDRGVRKRTKKALEEFEKVYKQ